MLEFDGVILHNNNSYCRSVASKHRVHRPENRGIGSFYFYPVLSMMIQNPVRHILLGKAPDRISPVNRVPREGIDVVYVLHTIMYQAVHYAGVAQKRSSRDYEQNQEFFHCTSLFKC